MMNPLPTPQESPVHAESMNRAVIHKPKDLDFAPWKQMRDSSLMLRMTPEGFFALRNTLSTARSWVRVVAFVALALQLWASVALAQLIRSVETIGMTVSDIDGASRFFSKALDFEKISDFEVYGGEYEKLQGLFGLRMRVVRMKLGAEVLELTQYLAPEGRPIPADWRSNDQAFQHIAIVTTDMV